MDKSILSIAKNLRDERLKAYVRRVMWLSFEERLEQVFNECQALLSESHYGEEFGNLYLYIPKPHRHYNRTNFLRTAQISAGWLRHFVGHTVGIKDPNVEAEEAGESGAAIFFTQNIQGKIAVFLYPHSSALSRVNEKQIMLNWGMHPNDLTIKELRKLIRLFLKYNAATSMMSAGRFKHYAFRYCLLFRDARNKNAQRVWLSNFIAKFVLPLAGLLATFLTSEALIKKFFSM
jgi:hypothetical protein